MKREDFKEIKEEHRIFCEDLIEKNGVCAHVKGCMYCPFCKNNTNTNVVNCFNNRNGINPFDKNPLLVKQAKEFLNTFFNSSSLQEKIDNFKDIKKGDRVYDLKYGWGTIRKLEKHFMNVSFDIFIGIGAEKKYNYHGRENGFLDKCYNRTLFLNEVKFDIPEKPFDVKKFFKENFIPYNPELIDKKKYHLEYKNDNTWRFVKDNNKEIVGSYYLMKANEEEEILNLTEELNEQNLSYSCVLKALTDFFN